MNLIIEMVISPTGDTRLETKGFTGNECLLASQFVESALGRRINQRTTSEYFLPVAGQANRQTVDSD